MAVRNWTREELIIVFNLYLKMDFGKMHRSNPAIIRLAELIGRTPDAVAMRLVNYASVDPFHQKRGVKGLDGGKKQVQPIWDEFIDSKEELTFESERILAQKEQTSLEVKYSEILKGTEHLKGETKIREVKTRVNQDVFRQIILRSYNNTCCITGIKAPALIIASHIIPWSLDENNRLNPGNGIALNALHDKAFDKGLITITPDFEFKVSQVLKDVSKDNQTMNDFFLKYEGQKIPIKARYLPAREFLEYHSTIRFA